MEPVHGGSKPVGWEVTLTTASAVSPQLPDRTVYFVMKLPLRCEHCPFPDPSSGSLEHPTNNSSAHIAVFIHFLPLGTSFRIILCAEKATLRSVKILYVEGR